MTPCRRPKVRRSRRQHSRCRHPGAPAPEETLWSLVTSLKCGGTSFRHTKILSRVVGGCFSLCGRSPSGAPMPPVLAAPLFASGCAQSHAKHSPGPSDLVIWHNGEIGDVSRNGPVYGAPRTVLSSSGHRNTVLVAALSRTRLLCLRYLGKETSHRVSLCFSFYFVSLFVCSLPQKNFVLLGW